MSSDTVDIELLFSPVIHSDERLLWTGRPRPGSRDYRYVLGMIWGGAVSGFVGFMVFLSVADLSGRGFAFHIFDVLFIGIQSLLLAGCMAMTVTSWLRFSKPGRQSYAVTNKRIIFHDRRLPNSFESQLLHRVSNMWRTGAGNLIFGTAPHRLFYSISTALEKPPADRFINIPDPENVERIILGAASK